jgi:hypothetical protein
VTTRRRVLPPLGRDIFFLVLGGTWGTWTAYTEGPWPIMLISAATMMGPGFLRLWLSGPGTGARLSLPPEEPSEPQPSLSSGPSSPESEADRR